MDLVITEDEPIEFEVSGKKWVPFWCSWSQYMTFTFAASSNFMATSSVCPSAFTDIYTTNVPA